MKGNKDGIQVLGEADISTTFFAFRSIDDISEMRRIKGISLFIFDIFRCRGWNTMRAYFCNGHQAVKK